MSREEMARLLAKIQLGDNRTVTALTLSDWLETVGHLDYRDAYEAVVEHRRNSTEYLMPAHVVRGARKARAARERAQAREQLAITPRVITKPPPEVWARMVQEAIEQNGGKHGRSNPGPVHPT